MNETAPLIALERARLASGSTTTEPLTASGGARRVALVGYFSPLFRLLRNDARLASGAVRIAGEDVARALRLGDVALARFEAPALRWTARRYLVESARLALFDRRSAERRADGELERAELGGSANLRLCDVDAGIRRRVSLASAAVTRARTIVAEAPLVELAAPAESLVANALERLAVDRQLVVSFPAIPLGGPARACFERADFSVVVARGVVSYAGPPVPNS